VRDRPGRPLLQAPDPRAVLAELQARRSPVYAEADVIVDSRRGASHEAMAREILRVGAVAGVSTVQTNVTVAATTALVGLAAGPAAVKVITATESFCSPRKLPKRKIAELANSITVCYSLGSRG
jgi:plasmid stability protein